MAELKGLFFFFPLRLINNSSTYGKTATKSPLQCLTNPFAIKRITNMLSCHLKLNTLQHTKAAEALKSWPELPATFPPAEHGLLGGPRGSSSSLQRSTSTWDGIGTIHFYNLLRIKQQFTICHNVLSNLRVWHDFWINSTGKRLHSWMPAPLQLQAPGHLARKD